MKSKVVRVVMRVVMVGTIAMAFCGTSARAQLFESGRSKAIRHTNDEASRDGAALDMFGVKWLQSAGQVRSARPNAQTVDAPEDGMVAMMEWSRKVFGLECGVMYVFHSGSSGTALTMVVVTFAGTPSRERFETVQSRLGEVFATMPATGGSELADLNSSRSLGGRFHVVHDMVDTPAGLREQFHIYRTGS